MWTPSIQTSSPVHRFLQSGVILWMVGVMIGSAFAQIATPPNHSLTKRKTVSTPARSLPGQGMSSFLSVRQVKNYLLQLKAAEKAEEAAKKSKELAEHRKHTLSSKRSERSREATHEAKQNRQHAGKEEHEAGVEAIEAYYYYLRQRAYPNDTINADAYRRAMEHRDKMPPGVRVKDNGIGIQTVSGNWNPLGPYNLPPSYQQYFGPGEVNGRVTKVAFDPKTANRYYLTSAGGGVWRTDDGGTNWKPLSDGPEWPHLQTNSIAINPKNPDILYVGTGDFDRFGINVYGFGIMKSTDGGTTWTNLPGAVFGNVAVSDIVVDPENPAIVTATTGRGPDVWGYVWQSTDSGNTWSKVITTAAPWANLSIGAKDGSGKRYYYAAGQFNGGQLWRSADRGATWTKLTTPMSNPADIYAQMGVKVAASPISSTRLYLLSGNDQKVWRSTDAGAHWTDITTDLPGGDYFDGSKCYPWPYKGPYNWSHWRFEMHITCGSRKVGSQPAHDALYVGLIDIVQCPNADATSPTWRSFGQTYQTDSLTHNDQHHLAVNPANANDLLVANDGGVYHASYSPVSNIYADTWSFTSLNSSLGITQFYRMAAHPTNASWLLAGAQDNGSPFSTGNGALVFWHNATSGGDGGFSAINPKNANIQYTSTQCLSIYQTKDAWASSPFELPLTNTRQIFGDKDYGSDTVAFIAPIALDINNPNLLYAATNYLYRYNDAGKTIEKRLGGQQLSQKGYVQYLAIAPSDSQRIYTGSVEGDLWMTKDAGKTWKVLHFTNPSVYYKGGPTLPDRAITSIDVHPTNPNSILIGYSGTKTAHLWACDDVTAKSPLWRNVSSFGLIGLPDIPLNAIARDIYDPDNTWYVGTDIGVFMTDNGGANWKNITNPRGLPNVPVYDLKSVVGTGYLNAATHGRGIWNIALEPPGPFHIDLYYGPPLVVWQPDPVIFQLVLNQPAPAGGLFIPLDSSNPQVASVPEGVFVEAGQQSVNIPVTLGEVGYPTTVLLNATLDGVSEQGQITVTYPTSLSGFVNLEECANTAQEVTFEFRPTDGSPAFTRTVTLTGNNPGVPNSYFNLTDIPAYSYDVAVKGRKWLQQTLPVDVSQGAVSGLQFFLHAGDVNDDNRVDLDDLGLLALAFDTQPGEELFDERADLNCDGVVNLDDLGLVALNFDTFGDS